jgi:thioredoxin 1
MKYPYRKSWMEIAAVSLLGVGALAITCRFTPGCPLAPARDILLSANADSTGEEPMSTRIQSPREIAHADEATFEQQVLKSDVPVLVDFYADWCPPCRMLSRRLEQLAGEMPDAKIVKVNVDDSPQLASRYDISSIPSLLVFKHGQVIAAHVGLASTDQLRGLVSR